MDELHGENKHREPGRRHFRCLLVAAAMLVGAGIFSAAASAAPPANDNFASAQVLSGDPATAQGTTVQATRQTGEPEHADSGARATVWYQWTPTQSKAASVDACDANDYVAAVGVYTGSAVNALTEVSSGYCRTTFTAQAGTTYSIAVASYTDWTGSFTIDAETFDPPANDDFESAVEVTGSSVSGTTRGATSQPGEPTHGDGDAEATVWYSWTPSQSGTASLDACDDENYAIEAIAAYTGDALAGLTLRGTGYCRATFPATAGTTYRIALASYPEWGGEFTLKLAVVSAPANDAFASTLPPEPGIASFPVNGTTAGATSEPGEPDHDESGATATVWYRVTFANPGTYVLDACNEDDTVHAIAVYQGTSVNNLTRRGSDYCKLYVELAANTNYRIAIASYPGAWGPFSLKASYFPLPANDDFAAATVLDGDAVQANGYTYGATKQAGEPSHDGASGNKSVWYSWTPSQTGTATISLCANYDSVLAVYTGSAVGALTGVASDDDSFVNGCNNASSKVSFPAAAGTTYRIAVDGYDSSERGSFVILTNLAPGPLKRQLNVTRAGDGSGSVSSSPAGINCGSACSAQFDHDTIVTLSASASAGSTFAGWSGACAGTGDCVVTMDQARNVTASFHQLPVKRTLTVTADGAGTISSSPAGISCGNTCSAEFDSGTRVTLTATPQAGSTFGGWSGGCSGLDSCVVDILSDTSVVAHFQPIASNPALALTLTPRVGKVNAGKRISVKVKVESIGDLAVEKPRICLEVPKKLKKAIKKPPCQSFGSLRPGSSWNTALKLQTTAKAKGKIKLKVTLRSANAPARANFVVLKVKAKPKRR